MHSLHSLPLAEAYCERIYSAVTAKIAAEQSTRLAGATAVGGGAASVSGRGAGRAGTGGRGAAWMDSPTDNSEALGVYLCLLKVCSMEGGYA